MATDVEIVARLLQLRDGEITLDRLEEWFIEETWDVDTPLVRQVTGLLAETAGNAAADATMSKLVQLLSQPTMTVPMGEVAFAPLGRLQTIVGFSAAAQMVVPWGEVTNVTVRLPVRELVDTGR